MNDVRFGYALSSEEHRPGMRRRIRPYLDAWFDHVYMHLVGPDQAGFIDFAERELLPRLRGGKARRKAA